MTRQTISKWENNRGYPDLDNLVLLSCLYQLSIDELLKENIALLTADNKVKIGQTKPGKSKFSQSVDEGLILLLLTLVSSLIPPVGIFLPIYIIWRNQRRNRLYKLVNLVSVIVILVSLVGTYVVISDKLITPSQTKVYQIK